MFSFLHDAALIALALVVGALVGVLAASAYRAHQEPFTRTLTGDADEYGWRSTLRERGVQAGSFQPVSLGVLDEFAETWGAHVAGVLDQRFLAPVIPLQRSAVGGAR